MKKILISLAAVFMLSAVPQQANAEQSNYSDSNDLQKIADSKDIQDDGIRIVTGHPDFKIQVTRCEASGKTVVLDMLFINKGTSDIDNVELYNDQPTEVIDDQGDKFDYENISLRFANRKEYSGRVYGGSILPGVPLKVSMRIEGVPASAQNLVRIILSRRIDQWGLNYETPPIQIRNVPITRN